MKRNRISIGIVLACAVAACGGIVNVAPVDEDACEGQTCGDACQDGGTCTEDGVCSFEDVVCPPLCVLGECGDACSICVGDQCTQGFCTQDGFCVEGDVACAL